MEVSFKLLTYKIKTPRDVSNVTRHWNFKSKALNVVVSNMIACIKKDNVLVYTRDTAHKKGNTAAKTVKRVVDWLTEEGYAETVVGNASAFEEYRNPSILRPTQKFKDLWNLTTQQKAINEHIIASDTVVVRDSEKQPIILRTTKELKAMQELVRKLNELNESFDIMYENRPLTNIYCRIFNADFNHGGRYYKADILQMSNSETPRIDIKIDGESVVEVDFNNLHIRLAAAEHGLLDKLPDDPYAIDGGREFDRKIVKMAVNIMLNAKKRKSAILALAGSVDFDGSMFENAADVVAFVEKRLSFMKEVFFQPDSYGLYLQSLDSRIASLVIKSFVDIGEAILPVHDSFVVRKDMMAYLVVAMQDAFRAVTSVDCSVPLTAKSRLWQGDDAYIQIEKFR